MTTWTVLSAIFLVLILAATIFALTRRRHRPVLFAGGVYSVVAGDGRFSVAKVLVLERDAVHVRLYKNKFKERPIEIDASALSVGSLQDKEFGIAHLPLAEKEFLSWQPVMIMKQVVTTDELEGYRLWKETQGGVFGKL